MSVEIKDKQGNIIAKSRNLRGILDYARKARVNRAAIHRIADGAQYYIEFIDGKEVRGTFADFSVCVGWFRARRSWGLTAVRNSDDYWSFY